MSATSLKLSNDLRRRISRLVAGSNRTPHAFMVNAIEQAAVREELRRRFGEEADAAERETEKSGKAYDSDAVFDYFETRARGHKAKRPRLRSIATRTGKTWRRSA